MVSCWIVPEADLLAPGPALRAGTLKHRSASFSPTKRMAVVRTTFGAGIIRIVPDTGHAAKGLRRFMEWTLSLPSCRLAPAWELPEPFSLARAELIRCRLDAGCSSWPKWPGHRPNGKGPCLGSLLLRCRRQGPAALPL